jgi:hypothetical protein
MIDRMARQEKGVSPALRVSTDTMKTGTTGVYELPIVLRVAQNVELSSTSHFAAGVALNAL